MIIGIFVSVLGAVLEDGEISIMGLILLSYTGISVKIENVKRRIIEEVK